MNRFSKIILSILFVFILATVVAGCKSSDSQTVENSNNEEKIVQQANNGFPKEEPERTVDGEPDPYTPEE